MANNVNWSDFFLFSCIAVCVSAVSGACAFGCYQNGLTDRALVERGVWVNRQGGVEKLPR